MIHLSKKALVFALVSSYSIFSFAGSYFVDSIFPSGFYANYILLPNGAIVKASDKSKAMEVFNNKKDGSLDWSVNSMPCAQNKSFQCVGVYIAEDTKVQGNQMNPFADAVSKGGFTMLKLDPKNAENNSVIKCKNKFTQGMVRDEGRLANCFEYSKAICKNWYDYINKNAAEFSQVVDKVQECESVMKSVDKININLRNIFQGEIKQSEKNISELYDATTHPDRSVGLTTKTEFTQDKLSPHILTYKDIFERTSDCKSYEDIFTKGYNGTADSRFISSERAVSSKATQGGQGKGKTRN